MILLLTIVFGYFQFSCFNAYAVSLYRSFSDDLLMISFQYPDKWLIVPYLEESRVCVFSSFDAQKWFADKSTGSQGAQIVIGTKSLEGKDINTYFKNYIEKTAGIIKAENIREITLSGQKGFAFEYTTKKGPRINGLQVLSEYNNVLYFINCAQGSESKENYYESFNYVISSFNFLRPDTTTPDINEGEMVLFENDIFSMYYPSDFLYYFDLGTESRPNQAVFSSAKEDVYIIVQIYDKLFSSEELEGVKEKTVTLLNKNPDMQICKVEKGIFLGRDSYFIEYAQGGKEGVIIIYKTGKKVVQIFLNYPISLKGNIRPLLMKSISTITFR